MNEEDEQPCCWGTLEELLLACAVSRHGPESWDSVSAELCRRTTSNRRRHYTPPICRRRYADLRLRLSGDDIVAELKSIRVEELRREVEKHDDSIESLQLKLKRLEDEREGTDMSTEPVIKKPEPVLPAGSISSSVGPRSESNSTTGLKDELVIQSVEPKKPEPVRVKPVRSGKGRFEIGSSSGEDEPDGDEVPLAAKKIAIKSQPLIKILTIIRAHKNGSVFEHRLPSQGSGKYSKMIRQHIDLHTIQRRLEKGVYLNSHRKFFHDLLLLFTNALLFFPNNSNEYSAASELRKLVIAQMAKKIPKPDPVKKQSDPVRVKPEKELSPRIVVCRRRSLNGLKSGSDSVAFAKNSKEVEVKMKMKNSKVDAKVKERMIVKDNKLKGNNKQKAKVEEFESSSSDELDDDEEEMGRGRNSNESKNGKRGRGRREKGREPDGGKLGKRGGRPVAVAAVGRVGKKGKEGGGVAAAVGDTRRMRKRPRR